MTFRLRTTDLDKQIRVALLGRDGDVRKDIQRRARNVRDAARSNLRTRSAHSTGELERTIRFVTAETPNGLVAQIGSDDERFLWVEEGTGLFGPRHDYIRPRRVKFMRFNSQALGLVIFTEKIKGQPGKHALRDALSAAAV